MTTLRDLFALQHKYSVLLDSLHVQRGRLAFMKEESDSYRRQKEYVLKLERELEEFLDMEI
ncbi:hypothetical protein EVB55_122 [Rhizobium phage RHph_Y68]|uniref:Uncharacterized protein n=1 Tax=Rhizobium phage RHph_Y68 TaxID=2509787 RepID=A0A7S5QXY9_9CAUD|nr:hypothetical protein PP934_gp122 [Rhizobium phage RHph_Y68]QIG68057.1 hypothetical protein EVB55_122 [Rhizobium phage RHph_Y68]